MGAHTGRAKLGGYTPDPPHKRVQKDAGTLLRAAVSTSIDHASHEAFEWRPVLDQNRCGSCGGHGTAQAIYPAIWSLTGFQPSWLASPGGLYAATRELARAAMTPAGVPLPTPLPDDGVNPADLMTAVSTVGISPMRRTADGTVVEYGTANASPSLGANSDVDPANVGNDSSMLELERDAETLLVGEYRIDEKASDVIGLMCAALATGIDGRGSPLGLGVFVDTAFENWDPATGPVSAVNVNDPDGGGHWLAVTSFYTLPNGKRVFRGPNSWGQTWGDAGHFEVTEDFIRASASDIYVFTVRKAAS